MDNKAQRTNDLSDLKLYTLTEVEPILGVSHASLLRWVKDGKLKCNKVGGKWRITEEELRNFIAECKSN